MALTFLWVFTAYGMSTILVYGSIFENARTLIKKKSRFFGDLLSCMMCISSGASTAELLTNLGVYPVISITSNGYVGTVKTTDCSGDGGTSL
jgi:hypothetical protein